MTDSFERGLRALRTDTMISGMDMLNRIESLAAKTRLRDERVKQKVSEEAATRATEASGLRDELGELAAKQAAEEAKQSELREKIDYLEGEVGSLKGELSSMQVELLEAASASNGKFVHYKSVLRFVVSEITTRIDRVRQPSRPAPRARLSPF